MEEDKIIVYHKEYNQIEILHTLDNILWISREQLGSLFETDEKIVEKKISNIFREKELDEKEVCAEFDMDIYKEPVDKNSQSFGKVKCYNLDLVISLGYRIDTAKATKFRQWAKSETDKVNEEMFAQKEEQIKVLKNGINILGRAMKGKPKNNEWLNVFSKGLNLLDDYDHEQLDAKGLTNKKPIYPSLQDYQALIRQMTTFGSGVFGKEKDGSFESSVNQICQGFGDVDFYPTLEEKAAMLLYLVVKNHSFVDGNKRIAAACFLKFLQENNILFNDNDEPVITNDTLASLTLFIASSKPEEMETIKKLVISVLNRNKRVAFI